MLIRAINLLYTKKKYNRKKNILKTAVKKNVGINDISNIVNETYIAGRYYIKALLRCHFITDSQNGLYDNSYEKVEREVYQILHKMKYSPELDMNFEFYYELPLESNRNQLINKIIHSHPLRLLILGPPGSGTEFNFILPIIKKYPGTIIYISSSDRSNVLFQSKIKNTSIYEVLTLPIVSAARIININMDCRYEPASEENQIKLLKFLEDNIKNDTLVIIDDATHILGAKVRDIINHAPSKCIIVFQDVHQIYNAYSSHYDYKKICKKEILHNNWVLHNMSFILDEEDNEYAKDNE